MTLMRLVHLAHRFQTSRIGRFCGWISLVSMAWMLIASLGTIARRRYAGESFELFDAFLLVIAFFAANASRPIYLTIRSARSPATEGK